MRLKQNTPFAHTPPQRMEQQLKVSAEKRLRYHLHSIGAEQCSKFRREPAVKKAIYESIFTVVKTRSFP